MPGYSLAQPFLPKPKPAGEPAGEPAGKRPEPKFALNLDRQAFGSGRFADVGEAGFFETGQEGDAAREYLRRIAGGQGSISAEQLRQGLQQNLAAQRAMVAGAAPGNVRMGLRAAAGQAGRVGSGMMGQQALAGLQEREAAQKTLGDLILARRQQDIQAALSGRGQAASGYGSGYASQSGVPREPGAWDKYGRGATQTAADLLTLWATK